MAAVGLAESGLETACISKLVSISLSIAFQIRTVRESSEANGWAGLNAVPDEIPHSSCARRY